MASNTIHYEKGKGISFGPFFVLGKSFDCGKQMKNSEKIKNKVKNLNEANLGHGAVFPSVYNKKEIKIKTFGEHSSLKQDLNKLKNKDLSQRLSDLTARKPSDMYKRSLVNKRFQCLRKNKYKMCQFAIEESLEEDADEDGFGYKFKDIMTPSAKSSIRSHHDPQTLFAQDY